MLIGVGIIAILLLAGMLFLRKKPLWQRIRSPCRILFLFAALGFAAGMLEKNETDGLAVGEIKRREPGKGELETEAVFYLQQEDTEYPITLKIAERKYLKSEEQNLIQAAIAEIEETFCGENDSLENIASNPRIAESYQDGAVAAEWMFSDRELISEEGEINQDELKDEARQAEALVTLRCGETEENYGFSFCIIPKEKNRKEKAIAEIRENLASQEESNAVVTLPNRVGGQAIQWKSPPSGLPAELLGLGVLVAAAAFYTEKEQKEKKLLRRKNHLFLAYPEFVSKLSLLLGAGMSISKALRKMDQMYQKRKAADGRIEDVYEELYHMICEMDNGMGEIRAYQEFSEACDLQPYRKLASLLISGQKVGNRRLLEQLNEEADRIFAERKNAARKLGEEAGTKMLIPMMLMLLIVMGIVIIPAFLSIYGK